MMSEQLEIGQLCLKCMQMIPDGQDVCPYCGSTNSSLKPEQHHLPPYTILQGRYLIGVRIGEGGFGITYSAFDLFEKRRVAIKEQMIVGVVVRQGINLVQENPTEEEREYYLECQEKFLQEAKALQDLKEKNGVVDILNSFQENGTSYIVMEYLDGKDLKDYLAEKGGKISFVETYRLLTPVMRSLREIHRVGIIHRDISPGNIRYMSDDKMKILDFGSVKYTVENRLSHVPLVKHGYSPKEQYASGYMVGPWMDVYAMAATIYRCITGKKLKDARKRIDENDLELPSLYCEDISPKEEKVLLKGLAPEVDDRYRDMNDFYGALKEAYNQSDHGPGPGGTEQAIDDGYRELISGLNQKEDVWGTRRVIAFGLVAEAALIAAKLAGVGFFG